MESSSTRVATISMLSGSAPSSMGTQARAQAHRFSSTGIEHNLGVWDHTWNMGLLIGIVM